MGSRGEILSKMAFTQNPTDITRIKSLLLDELNGIEELRGYEITELIITGHESEDDHIHRLSLSITFTKGSPVFGPLSQSVIVIDISRDNGDDTWTSVDIEATPRYATESEKGFRQMDMSYSSLMNRLLEDATSFDELEEIQGEALACLRLIHSASDQIGLSR